MGERLHLSFLSEDSKHSVLLPTTWKLTELVILHNHMNLLHAGLKLTMTKTFRRFWIMSGRIAIQQVIHAYIPCVRHRAAFHNHKLPICQLLEFNHVIRLFSLGLITEDHSP